MRVLLLRALYGTSPRLAPGGLFKKKSRLPVAASAYWSMATMIACTC
jgi:hypothetical protein